MKTTRRICVVLLAFCCLLMTGCGLFKKGEEVVDGSKYSYAGISDITFETGDARQALLYMDLLYGDMEYLAFYYQNISRIDLADFITFDGGNVILNDHTAIDGPDANDIPETYEVNQVEIGTYSGSKIDLYDETFTEAYIKDGVLYIEVETENDSCGKLTAVISFEYVQPINVDDILEGLPWLNKKRAISWGRTPKSSL